MRVLWMRDWNVKCLRGVFPAKWKNCANTARMRRQKTCNIVNFSAYNWPAIRLWIMFSDFCGRQCNVARGAACRRWRLILRSILIWSCCNGVDALAQITDIIILQNTQIALAMGFGRAGILGIKRICAVFPAIWKYCACAAGMDSQKGREIINFIVYNAPAIGNAIMLGNFIRC